MSREGTRIGAWTVTTVPEDWEPIEGHGFMLTREGYPGVSVVFTEDSIEADEALRAYVERQADRLRGHLPDIRQLSVEEPRPDAPSLHLLRGGGGESSVRQRQLYRRAEEHVGVVTFTAPEKHFADVEGEFERFAAGCTLRPQGPAAEP